ncbi:MAG: tRNA (guanosine(37)-N1)-methyltransferase TrmD [Azospirillaceae bacterium]
MTGPPWTAIVLTLFPEMFPGPLGLSIHGKAAMRGLWALETLDIRTFARDKHRSVDDTPFGGGAGMVMKPDVVSDALSAAAGLAPPGVPVVYLSPRGRPFDQGLARRWAAGAGIVLLCGRYEGVDQRALDAHAVEEVSLGDFVLSGGEVAAMALLEATVRLLPGVMGNEESAGEESYGDVTGLLEYPHYTRPAVWRGPDGVDRQVPETLLSGHHAKVAAWRLGEAERITRDRRPDLWQAYRARRGDDAEGRKRRGNSAPRERMTRQRNEKHED